MIKEKLLKQVMRMKPILMLVALFLTSIANAQLSDFNLTVAKTDETCSGNGSLTMSVSNTTANAIVLYKVYQLPNTTNPIAVLTSSSYLPGLHAANYKVVAVQSLGSMLNTKEQTVTIANQIVSFTFSITSLNHNCSAGGGIALSSANSNIAQCEIISGPVTRPMQTSNVFDNLPTGTYNVRAYNDCGVGKVKTYSLSVANSVLTISDPVYPDAVNTICDSITVNNIISSSGAAINYPLTVTHTLVPMDLGGNTMVINQYFATGSPDSQTVSAVLPRYMSQSYTYELTVTDNCNTTYQKTDNVVDPNVVLALSQADAPCAKKYLVINVSGYTNSYTVNFLSYPDGFDPAAFNTTPQGPFTNPATNFGSVTNPVPFGNYEVEITDACGRTATQSLLIEFIKPKPSASGYNNGCYSLYGGFTVSVPPQHIVSAVITAAPAQYTQSLPRNANANINSHGDIKVTDLPLGDYTITFTDDCGFDYIKTVTVPVYTPKEFTIAALPSCDADFGGVRYRSGNGPLTAVAITAAPTTYTQSLPYDVLANLSTDGAVYMNNLPAGTYEFTATDICGDVKAMTVDVTGYNKPLNPYAFIPNCGTFSVKMTDTSNGTEGATYWLQKYFPDTDTWGHPGTAVVYTEGTVPVDANSIKLFNNSTRNNLGYYGKFRIIKKFETFGNATSQNNMCISELGQFNYNDALTISTAYSLSCLGTPGDVMLETTGYPIVFKIIKKNDATFVVNNGNSNIFHNLEPATYVFQVENACGDVVVQTYNVQDLPSVADAKTPDDMVFCQPKGEGTTHQFHLSDQDAAVLGPLYSSLYNVSYYLTAQDRDNAVNPLPADYTNVTNGQEIFVRLVNNQIGLCYGSSSFKLFVGEYQEPVITTQGTVCSDGKVALRADAGYDSYLWSNGETTRTIFVSDPGTYTVIVQKNYGNGFCDGFAEVEIKQSYTPNVTKVITQDWTRDQNSITVETDGPGNFVYSIDGGATFQESNEFTGLETGLFNVIVKDINGCGSVTKEVVLMNYPNYFTPNGDGQHETWFIPYSSNEPHFKVAIFDRFGKLITTFDSSSTGWDGTLNGIQLPSTDYWFVVTREDGRELRGHFAMLR